MSKQADQIFFDSVQDVRTQTRHVNDITWSEIPVSVLADVTLSCHSSSHSFVLFSWGSHWGFGELADTHLSTPLQYTQPHQPPLREINAVVCSKLCLIIALREVGRVSPVQLSIYRTSRSPWQQLNQRQTLLNCGCLHWNNPGQRRRNDYSKHVAEISDDYALRSKEAKVAVQEVIWTTVPSLWEKEKKNQMPWII